MREYEVDINGIPHTVQLSEEDAKARDAVEVKSKAPTANKARTASNKKE